MWRAYSRVQIRCVHVHILADHVTLNSILTFDAYSWSSNINFIIIQHKKSDKKRRAREASKVQHWYRANKKRCYRSISGEERSQRCEIPLPELQDITSPNHRRICLIDLYHLKAFQSLREKVVPRCRRKSPPQISDQFHLLVHPAKAPPLPLVAPS